MEEQIAALAKAVHDGRAANDARLDAIQQSLELWRPSVTNLQQQLDELRTQVGRIALHPMLTASSTSPEDAVVQPVSSPPTDDPGHHGSSGHSRNVDSGGSAHGVVTTLVPPPVTGEPLRPPFPLKSGELGWDLAHTVDLPPQSPHVSFGGHGNWALPRLDFPSFDGENPQFWKNKCEKYFSVYGVQREMWVRVSTLHFEGNAARWLHVQEAHDTSFTWETLCSAVCAKFGREQYQVQLRQFNTLRRIGSVTVYMEQFEELMHRLLAHNPAFDPLFFTTQFLDGLKTDIKVGVALHRPQDLDSTFSLSLLQEELMGLMPRKDPGQARHPARPLPAAGGLHPRPVPPAPPAAAEDRRALDAAWAADRRAKPARGEDRVAALRNYRRARGLYFKCGERWGQGHQCAATVQLHVVEELLEMLQAEAQDRQGTELDSDEEQLMSISKVATTGATTPRTVRLLGLINGHEVLILVDLGSSHSFISEETTQKLKAQVQLMQPVSVKIVDGGTLTCFGYIPACETTQGQRFETDVRVLPLGSYDMVVGMDWLEACGPMLVDWTAKTLQFQHQGASITLVGLQPKLQQVEQVTMDQLLRLEQRVKPINIRPYRYTPEQKDEIEAQVKEMLEKGLITPSTSAFSSPVLLVKKKDQTWRFCVDYRHLNTITVKKTYPMPVIDELLDELAGSKWFSKLDLRAGYHQIRLVPEDEHKTAFRTHLGHFQFRVMPYGLAYALATFQGVVDTVLKPVLRHGVLAFMDDILIHSEELEEHRQLLKRVLQLLAEKDLKAKMSKCTFSQQEISYLGHVISDKGVAIDKSKIQVVQEWPQPQNVKELRGFFGLAGYYRKFVRFFGVLSKPLTEMLKKGVIFIWTPTAEAAFSALKQALVQAPVLALPDFRKQFVVETDASATGIGAVLMQGGHPVAYLSKALAPRNLGLSAYEKECLALLLAIDHWRPYLQHLEFMYKTGVTNRAADALSRCEHKPESEMAAISICKPKWLEAIKHSYQADPAAQQRMTKLALAPDSEPDYTLQDGILRFRGRVWIGEDTDTQQHLIRALHDSAAGGHSGFHATYNRVKRLFTWKGMKL
ncbi:uncharacterized protein [Aegilops tauschii subsp. strangulata]|uniref:uncharacterized protein n=2 Tax=Aegilops tauschii subsp. strangulata TaxID=200361 RepID=UPI003CC853A0